MAFMLSSCWVIAMCQSKIDMSRFKMLMAEYWKRYVGIGTFQVCFSEFEEGGNGEAKAFIGMQRTNERDYRPEECLRMIEFERKQQNAAFLSLHHRFPMKDQILV
ncbi:hypothetical protein DPSP01_010218 [Paraphaeosphaeria sporulosa]